MDRISLSTFLARVSALFINLSATPYSVMRHTVPWSSFIISIFLSTFLSSMGSGDVGGKIESGEIDGQEVLSGFSHVVIARFRSSEEVVVNLTLDHWFEPRG